MESGGRDMSRMVKQCRRREVKSKAAASTPLRRSNNCPHQEKESRTIQSQCQEFKIESAHAEHNAIPKLSDGGETSVSDDKGTHPRVRGCPKRPKRPKLPVGTKKNIIQNDHLRFPHTRLA